MNKETTGLLDEEMPEEEAPADGSDEQGTYNSFVTNGMQAMYDKKAMPVILKTIEGAGDPVRGLASALAAVITRVEDSAMKSGVQLTDEMKGEGVRELVHALAELAGPKGADIHTFSPKEIKAAVVLASNSYKSSRMAHAQAAQGVQSTDRAPAPSTDRAHPSGGLLA